MAGAPPPRGAVASPRQELVLPWPSAPFPTTLAAAQVPAGRGRWMLQSCDP